MDDYDFLDEGLALRPIRKSPDDRLYNYREAVQYCKNHGIRLSDLSKEGWEMFFMGLRREFEKQ